MKEDINDELNTLHSNLAGSKVDIPYTIPNNYFSDMAQKVLQATDGSNTLPIHKDMPYQVPSLYFHDLADKVIEKATQHQKKGVLLSFTTLRWAAAAMLLVMVGASVVVSINNQSNGIYYTNKGVAVADKDIEAYFADNARPDIALLPDVTYFNYTDVQAKDIISYLDETGWDTEYYN